MKATKNGEPESISATADPGVRDMISALFVLRLLRLGQPVCMEVFAGRKVWKLPGQMAARESIDTPLGRFDTLRFDGDAVGLDDPTARRARAHVWVTDDERHLPLVASGDVKRQGDPRAAGSPRRALDARRDERISRVLVQNQKRSRKAAFGGSD